MQQRSCEFDRLLKSSNPGIFAQLLENMPALSEAEYVKATGSVSLISTSDFATVTSRCPLNAPPSAAALY